jgi:hypothetical protein
MYYAGLVKNCIYCGCNVVCKYIVIGVVFCGGTVSGICGGY